MDPFDGCGGSHVVQPTEELLNRLAEDLSLCQPSKNGARTTTLAPSNINKICSMAVEILVRIFDFLPHVTKVASTCRRFRQCLEKRLWERIYITIALKADTLTVDLGSLRRLEQVMMESPGLMRYVKIVTLSVKTAMSEEAQLGLRRLLAQFPNARKFSLGCHPRAMGVPEPYHEWRRVLGFTGVPTDFKPDRLDWSKIINILNGPFSSTAFRTLQIENLISTRIWIPGVLELKSNVETVRAFECTADGGTSLGRLLRSIAYLKVFDIVLGENSPDETLRTTDQDTLYSALKGHARSLQELHIFVKENRSQVVFYEDKRLTTKHLAKWSFGSFVFLKKLVLPHEHCFSFMLWRNLPQQLESLQINHGDRAAGLRGNRVKFEDLRVAVLTFRILARNRTKYLPFLAEAIWYFQDGNSHHFVHQVGPYLQQIRDCLSDVGIRFTWHMAEQFENDWHNMICSQ